MIINKKIKAFILLLLAILPSWSYADKALLKQISSLIQGAKEQIGQTLTYDPAYETLDYPMGDVCLKKGVCSDVLIRAFRAGLSLDLQVAIHKDMKCHWKKYPKLWGLSKPDSNIDHRRVPNLVAFFTAYRLKISSKNYLPGDIVTWKVLGLPHIGLISDRTYKGRPLVIHNIGAGTQEEDCLYTYPITGHFRLTSAFIEQFKQKTRKKSL